MTPAIDGLVNVDLGDRKPPDWMVRVEEGIFRSGESFFRNRELTELLMATRGRGRVIHASGSPVLSMERCLGEISALEIGDDARRAGVHDKAATFFFGDAR